MNQASYPTIERNPDQEMSRPTTDICAALSVPDQPQLAAGCIDVAAAPVRNRPRQITIQAKDHGFVVEVGCQTFAVEKISTLIRNLEKYLEHPAETEKNGKPESWSYNPISVLSF